MITANPDIPNIPKTPDLETRLSFGPARPLVLFPVRLETRFFQQTDGTTDLCVRVYPDKVHVDSHEPKLTDDELTWGKHFWEQMSEAGTGETVRRSSQSCVATTRRTFRSTARRMDRACDQESARNYPR